MVNIGIVGCGYWGPKHIRNFHEIPGANPTVVCDLDENRLRQVRAQYPYIQSTTSFEELLRDSVDAVVVATPVDSHYVLAREALLNDKHVLIEKPMTTSSQKALELIELAESRNLVLMAGHTYIYNPAVVFLKQLISNGELGDVYGIDSDRLNLGLFRTDVNVLWDVAPHDIYIILSLLQEELVAVSARGACHIEPNVYDVAYLELLFSSGSIANIHVSWLHPRKIRQLTVIGSKKMAVYDDLSDTEKILVYDKGLTIPDNGASKFSAWPPNYRYGDVVIPYISNAEPLRLECTDFLESITEGKNPKSDGWAGLMVTSTLEAANVSLANGGQREKVSLQRPIQRVAEISTHGKTEEAA